MSDAAPPLEPASPVGERPEGPLTPDLIDCILSDFRGWLTKLPAADAPSEPAIVSVDLHALVGQFVALRHEVNLQTKASRCTLDQNGDALRQLEEAVDELRQASENEDGPGESLKPLLRAVVDVYDALALAVRQVERQKDNIFVGLETVLDIADIEPPPECAATAAEPRPGFWRRLAGGNESTKSKALIEWRERVIQKIEEGEQRMIETCDFLRQSLDGLLTGYTMSLNRIERVLPQFALEPMNCVGERYDPETMEVVEVAVDSGRPAGEVVEEIRRGYHWHGNVFRYAQVRVAK